MGTRNAKVFPLPVCAWMIWDYSLDGTLCKSSHLYRHIVVLDEQRNARLLDGHQLFEAQPTLDSIDYTRVKLGL